MPYVQAPTTNIRLNPAGGIVTVAVDEQQPQPVVFGLVLEDKNGSITERIVADSAQLRHPFIIGRPAAVTGQILVCYGRIANASGGLFEVHCEFYQDGIALGRSGSAAGSLTAAGYVDFGIFANLV